MVRVQDTAISPSIQSLRRRLDLLVLTLLIGCSSLPAPFPQPHTRSAISQTDLRTRLFVFSDDSMLGRSSLNPGHERATDYLAAELKRMRLVPGGEQGTYFQTFSLRARRLSAASILIVGDSILRPTIDFKVFAIGHGQPRSINGTAVIFGGVVGDTASQISRQQASNRVVLLGVPANMTAERVYANVVYGPKSRFRDAVAVAIASLDYLPANQRAITSSVGLADTAELPASGHPTSMLVSRRAATFLLGRELDHAEAGSLGRTVTGKRDLKPGN